MTMAITARAAEMSAAGLDIISFSVGEPDFATPPSIVESAHTALTQGQTKYGPAGGIPSLRQAISDKLLRENNLRYTPEQVVVTVGAKQACYEAIHALIDPGDEVLIPAPYWVSYPQMVKLVGGLCRVIPTHQNDNYKLKPDALAAAITKRSRMLILNSPNNPGGFCYTPQELRALAQVLKQTDIVVLSDEVYEKLIYQDTVFSSFAAAAPEMFERTITINGFSKSYAMTGWRIGYVAAPIEIAQAIERLQSHMTTGPTTFCQIAALTALQNTAEDVEQMRQAFAQRAALIHQRLTNLPDVTSVPPTGAFYVFPDVSLWYQRLGVAGSVDFCQRLLTEAHVACVPGTAFGCDNNIRLSFAADIKQIETGMDRIKTWLAKYA
ncbi:MAG: pyridoxal phosphate-dependent aminotransferase [Sedimentisphaerales bacterium]|nr:pyridoxal phosphate-dependent aminotransferase [Sedimentisphaerales bacterium]